MSSRRATLAILAAILSTACPGPKDDPADVEGCEHLEEGPAVSVTASADGGTAPAIRSDHKRYDVQLVDVAGGKGGRVTFAPSAAGDYVFFLDADVAAKFLDSAGAEVAVERSEKSTPTCVAVKGRHQLALGVGTYRLSLGPGSVESVGIVVEPAAHEH